MRAAGIHAAARRTHSALRPWLLSSAQIFIFRRINFILSGENDKMEKTDRTCMKGEKGMENSREILQNVIGQVRQVVVGKEACVEKIMMAMLANGHVLMEDIPGVGKTTMAVAFARALGLEARRMQFTSDVLPSDITGFSVYRKDLQSFVYQPGAVFCNLFLADEINRTSPKTQSALLEVMEERQVTVEGVTRQVPKPFMVIATQNPSGSAGTQMLPESQMDRFLICLSMGYPELSDEIAILKGRSAGNPLEDIVPAADVPTLLQMQTEVEQVFVHEYAAKLVRATRVHPMAELGMSPRGGLALMRMMKASAYLKGRNYVTPKDMEQVFVDVGVHRIRLNARARAGHVTSRQILEEVLTQVPRPVPAKR